MATKRKGLLQKHHGELNSYEFWGQDLEVVKKRYEELRKQYADDPVALQQIDVYDSTPKYHLKFREYRDALKNNGTKKLKKLEAWFKKNYPDI